MDHHGVVASREIFFAPDFVEQLLRTDDPAAVRTQEPQDGEFGGGKGEGFFVERAFVGVLIENQPRKGDHTFIRLAFCAVVLRGPAQLRFYPRDHLEWAEGFGRCV